MTHDGLLGISSRLHDAAAAVMKRVGASKGMMVFHEKNEAFTFEVTLGGGGGGGVFQSAWRKVGGSSSQYIVIVSSLQGPALG